MWISSVTALPHLCLVFSQFCYSISSPLFCCQSVLLQHYLTSFFFFSLFSPSQSVLLQHYLTSVLLQVSSVTALAHLCFVVNQFCYSISSPLFCCQALLLQHYLTSVLWSVSSVTALPHLCFVIGQFCYSISSLLFCCQWVLLQHYLTSVLLSVTSVPTSYMYAGPARQAVSWFVWL